MRPSIKTLLLISAVAFPIYATAVFILALHRMWVEPIRHRKHYRIVKTTKIEAIEVDYYPDGPPFLKRPSE
jgi:predicted membrane protein